MVVTIPDGTPEDRIREAALEAIEAGSFETVHGPELHEQVEGVSQEWEIISADPSET